MNVEDDPFAYAIVGDGETLAVVPYRAIAEDWAFISKCKVVPLYRSPSDWACLNEEIVSLRAEIARLKATSAQLWDIAASSIDPPERRRMLDRLAMDSFSEDG